MKYMKKILTIFISVLMLLFALPFNNMMAIEECKTFIETNEITINSNYIIVDDNKNGIAHALAINDFGEISYIEAEIFEGEISLENNSSAIWNVAQIGNSDYLCLTNTNHYLKLNEEKIYIEDNLEEECSFQINSDNNLVYKNRDENYLLQSYDESPYFCSVSEENKTNNRVYIFVEEQDNEKQVNEVEQTSSADYLAFTSDAHNGCGNLSSALRTSNWLSNVSSKIGSKFDILGSCGDMGDPNSYGDAYWNNSKEFMDAVDNSDAIKNKGFFITGNHEIMSNPGGDYANTKNSQKGRIVKVGSVLSSNETASNSYVLYSFGAEDGGSNNTYNISSTAISNLDTYLSSAPTDRPIFILSHFPLHQDGLRNIKNADKVIETLNKYAINHTIIFLWGHNHTDVSGAEKHYDKIYTGKLDNTNIKFVYASAGCMCDSEKSPSEGVKGKGLVAKLQDGYVTLSYYDVNYNELTTQDSKASIAYVTEPEKCGDNAYYKIENNTLNIFGYGSIWNYDNLGNRIVDNYLDINNVIIENGITSIGDYAFYDYQNLESIDIPISIESIGSNAFNNCNKINKIVLTGDCPVIDSSCFVGANITIYYPKDNTTYNSNTMKQYGGTINWVSYNTPIIMSNISISHSANAGVITSKPSDTLKENYNDGNDILSGTYNSIYGDNTNNKYIQNDGTNTIYSISIKCNGGSPLIMNANGTKYLVFSYNKYSMKNSSSTNTLLSIKLTNTSLTITFLKPSCDIDITINYKQGTKLDINNKAQLNGDGTINLDYKVSIPNTINPSNTYVSINGNKVLLSSLNKDNNDYIVPVDKIAMKNISDISTIQFIDKDNNPITNEIINSPVKYLNSLIDDPFIDSDMYDFIVSTLNLGAYSQIYFNYNKDNLSNKGHAYNDTYLNNIKSDDNDKAIITNNSNNKVSLYGMSLTLEDKIISNVYLKIKDTNKIKAYIDNNEVSLTNYKDDIYLLSYSSGSSAPELKVKHNYTIKYDGNVIFTYCISSLTYAQGVISTYSNDDTKTNLVNLCKVMYDYNSKAIILNK